MSYQINELWFERTKLLSVENLIFTGGRFNEIRLCEEELPSNPSVLDVGVGLGFETAYLLENGAQVDAIDEDNRVLTELEKRCSIYKPNLNTFHLQVPFANPITGLKKYDLIILSNVLHYLDAEMINKTIKQLTPLLTDGGFMLLRAHSKRHPYNEINNPKHKNYKYFFDETDIERLFPAQYFDHRYISEYRRTYNKDECRLYGYNFNDLPYKYGLAAVLKKRNINAV